MKLRRKQDGKIYEVELHTSRTHGIVIDADCYLSFGSYDTLHELLDEWEEVSGTTIDEPETPTNWATEQHITSKLNCGLEIALDDYWEIDENGDKKTEFALDEALEIEEKTGGKWRVPKMSEWATICEKISEMPDRDIIVNTLRLTADEDGYGNYWSGTAYSSNLGYCLVFDSDSVYFAGRNRNFGRSVRLVRGDK